MNVGLNQYLIEISVLIQAKILLFMFFSFRITTFVIEKEKDISLLLIKLLEDYVEIIFS